MNPEQEFPPTGRSAEYPFTSWQQDIESAVNKLRKRPRYSGVNAFRSLRRAWIIADLDPEMALFRAITAEEEAATALILALKEKHYPGADKLDHRAHSHKTGISPFLRVIESFFAEIKFPTPKVTLSHHGKHPRFDIDIPVAPDLFARPDEPLNGLAHQSNNGNLKVLSFEKQLQNYADVRGAASMLTVIRDQANFRNRLLYATDQGIPVAKDVDSGLIARGKPVGLLLALTIIILQTPMHQLFAVQSLQAYLRALKALPEDLYDYATELAQKIP